MDPTKVAVRLKPDEKRRLIRWANAQIDANPALEGRLFRIDGTPKMSTIVREAALQGMGS